LRDEYFEESRKRNETNTSARKRSQDDRKKFFDDQEDQVAEHFSRIKLKKEKTSSLKFKMNVKSWRTSSAKSRTFSIKSGANIKPATPNDAVSLNDTKKKMENKARALEKRGTANILGWDSSATDSKRSCGGWPSQVPDGSLEEFNKIPARTRHSNWRPLKKGPLRFNYSRARGLCLERAPLRTLGLFD
jgi:hypothetical protein